MAVIVAEATQRFLHQKQHGRAMASRTDDTGDDRQSSEMTSGRDSSERLAMYSSDELLKGLREAWIEHDGQIYRLRVTSRGNLILTK
jgi:hemin uptake protein HemP